MLSLGIFADLLLETPVAVYAPAIAGTVTNGTTAVDILTTTDLPKRITSLTIYNKDTAPKTVQVFLNDTGTSYLIVNITLQPGETLGYSEATQWYTGGQTGPFALLNGNSLQTFQVAPATTGTMAPQALYTRQKNDFFNGQFRIAQAGTSVTSPVDGAYDLDGCQTVKVGVMVSNVAQVAGSSAGKLARQVTVTTADNAIVVADFIADLYRLEGYNIVKYIGNTFTIAFKHKFPKAGIHCVALRNTGNDRSYVVELNVAAANTWADYSFTVVGGLSTAGTWDYTNGVGLQFFVVHAAGTNYQTTAGSWQTGNFLSTASQVNDVEIIGAVWAIEDLRIALGAYCPPDDSSYAENLEDCEAYCLELNSSSTTFGYTGYLPANNIARVGVNVRKKMRTTPTLSSTAGSVNINVNSAAGNTASSSLAFTGNNNGGGLDITVAGTPFTIGQGCSVGIGQSLLLLARL